MEYSSKTERFMVGAMWCGVQLKDRKTHGWRNVVWSTAHRQTGPWWEQCGVEYSSKTERSMVGAMWCEVQLKDRKIHGGSNVV